MSGNERSVSRLDYKSEEDDIQELVKSTKPVMDSENIADKTVTDETSEAAAAAVTTNNDDLDDDLAEQPQLNVTKRTESTSELIPAAASTASSAESSKRESLSNSHSFEHQSSNHLVMMTKILSFREI